VFVILRHSGGRVEVRGVGMHVGVPMAMDAVAMIVRMWVHLE
jgi:hypothetical protein